MKKSVRYKQGKTLKLFAIACVMMLAIVTFFGQGMSPSFSPLVDGKGNISFPKDFPNGFVHIGTVAVAGNGGVTETHATYTRPSDADYYRANGKFPDGAVLIKDVEGLIGSPHTTGNAFWASERKTWFLMIKDGVGRFKNNPLWGDGWGWAQYDPKDNSKQIAKDYKTDCLQCHVPAKSADWVYVYAYSGLGERALKFTPSAARAAGVVDVKQKSEMSSEKNGNPAMVATGKEVFMTNCSSCHMVEPGKNNTGPTLFGIVGRKAGTEATYAYSPAMKDAGVTWTRENLLKFLANPKGFIPGNRMGRFFGGLESSEERDALVRYLETVK